MSQRMVPVPVPEFDIEKNDVKGFMDEFNGFHEIFHDYFHTPSFLPGWSISSARAR